MSAYHTPVLLQESITALSIRENGVYVDATFGGGGHSREILRHLGPEGRLIAFDKDADALAQAPEDERLTVVQADFRQAFLLCTGEDGLVDEAFEHLWQYGDDVYSHCEWLFRLK